MAQLYGCIRCVSVCECPQCVLSSGVCGFAKPKWLHGSSLREFSRKFVRARSRFMRSRSELSRLIFENRWSRGKFSWVPRSRSKQVDYIRQYSWRNSYVEKCIFWLRGWMQSASNFWVLISMHFPWVRISRYAIAPNYLLIYRHTRKIEIKSRVDIKISATV